jgi:putative oxidoreductase
LKRNNCCTDDYGPVLNLLILSLRIAVALLMLTHGIPKLINLLSGNWSFADPIGLGPEISLILVIFAEVFCSVLILIGYKSRLASMPLIFTMLVALLVVHSNDPIFDHWNILLYLLAYGLLLHLGGGKYSLTYYLHKKTIKS